MAELQKVNGQTIIDYMARDFDSLMLAMRDLIPTKLPEWREYESEADFGNVLLQLFAHMGDILSYYQDRIANESYLGTAQLRSSIIQHLRLIGYRLATAAPASTTLRLTVPGSFKGLVTIRRGDAFATKSLKDSPSVRFEYAREVDLVVDCGLLTVVDGKKTIEGVPMEEGRLIRDEILGTSDGSPNQTFRLSHPRLILRSLGQGQQINRDIILITELAETIEVWTLQESLAFSRGSDTGGTIESDEAEWRGGQRDFSVEIDESDQATVRFGDGVFGAIPSRGAVIKATYRIGGGRHGNVAARTIKTIVDAPQLSLIGAEVTNPASASGGAERESIEHAVRHAPVVFRSMKRAVTEGDYKALALDFKGVGKVRAEPNGWNTVALFVAPAGGGQVSDVLKENLLAYFEDKRQVTTVIEIQDVDYVDIYVTAEIGVKGYYSSEDVKEKVQRAGGQLLAFENVDFGQTIYLSKFYEAIESIEGVEFVNIKEFRRQEMLSGTVEPAGKIKLGINEIPTAPVDQPTYAGGIRVVLPEEEG